MTRVLLFICKSFIMIPAVKENLNNNDDDVCHPPTQQKCHDKLLNCLTALQIQMLM